MTWIKCTVAPPPKARFIGYDEYYGRVGEAYWDGHLNDAGEPAPHFVDSDDCYITHWHVLPAPPRKDRPDADE